MKVTDLGTVPISPAAPAGEDVREQDLFLDLQAEVNRSQSFTSGASAIVDWTKVREIASKILETRSKDLLVAAYLSVSLARKEGPAGVLDGITLMNGMVKEYWESLFPPVGRLRARRNALSWWMDQMQEILPVLSGAPLFLEDLGRCMKELRELNGFLGEKDPDAPSLSPLYSLVEALPVSISETVSDDTPAETTAPAGPNESPFKGGMSIPVEGDPLETLEQISPVLQDLSARISEEDPGDSRALFLSRFILWEGIREIPESENKMTRVPAPPSHFLSALETLTASGSEEDRLRFLLARQADVPFWFELSFMAGRILETGRPDGFAGAEALRGTLRTLLARLPGIDTLFFSGGEIPFLSEEGRAWVLPGGSPKGEGEGEERPDRTSSLLAPVRSAIADGRLIEASERFDEIRRREPSPRGRFLLNLELLEAVERMGRDFPVLSLALVLLEDLERVRLDLWEPVLAARALPLIGGILSSSGDDILRRRAEELSGRLAAFDITGAIRAFQSGR